MIMSNEKRLQQIRDAARYKYPDERIHFIDGAKWADSHPAWVSVEERLPEPNIYKEGKTFPLVLVCLNDGCVDTDAYDTDNNVWCKYDGEVEYWMVLPTPPVKKGGEQ